MPLTSQLEAIFNSFGITNLGDWSKFAQIGNLKIYNKGEIIKEAYQVDRHLNILLKGKAYATIWEREHSHCTDLYGDGEFCSDYTSFINQEASPVEIKTLSKSRIFSINHNAFIQLLENSKEAEKITRTITNAQYASKKNQHIELLTKSASERLSTLQQKYPDILERFPKKIVASYLGVTPQSLSRLIKNT